MRTRIVVLSGLFLLFFQSAAASELWLHVEVENQEKKEDNVKVNVPLSLVGSMLPLVGTKHLMGRILKKLPNDYTVADLRQIWETVRSRGDAVLLQVETSEDRVRASLEGDRLVVRSLEGSGDAVEISLPTTVVGALLSGDGNELDLEAAFRAIQQLGAQDLVSVVSNKETVRVWIDEGNGLR